MKSLRQWWMTIYLHIILLISMPSTFGYFYRRCANNTWLMTTSINTFAASTDTDRRYVWWIDVCLFLFRRGVRIHLYHLGLAVESNYEYFGVLIYTYDICTWCTCQSVDGFRTAPTISFRFYSIYFSRLRLHAEHEKFRIRLYSTMGCGRLHAYTISSTIGWYKGCFFSTYAFEFRIMFVTIVDRKYNDTILLVWQVRKKTPTANYVIISMALFIDTIFLQNWASNINNW